MMQLEKRVHGLFRTPADLNYRRLVRELSKLAKPAAVILHPMLGCS